MVKFAKKKKTSPLTKRALPKNIKELPFNRFIPNLITLATLCAGLSAIRFGLVHQWEYAILAIAIAAILDGMDGRIARFLGAASRFGAELDSLADFCNFGIAPAILVYLYQLDHVDRFGWLICLFFSMCMALRLARFNAFLEETPPPLFATGKFFMGVPAPAGGLLVCMPMIIDFQIYPFKVPFIIHMAVVFTTACLLISRIPTFSFKKGVIPRNLALPVFVIAGVVVASFIMVPWLILSLLAFVYIGLIPLSIRHYNQLEKELQLS
ncbi:MAG: phosphatidylcholine/phosphatidylserine synthase [Alphaproteobacteria bacterium]|jgi:CDP-diacylglycerol--serine O-phosphatidyltransferase|nr:phosphatidylcholine/phosphatidylserine synthase [Alphaproteobacteria bacterium]